MDTIGAVISSIVNFGLEMLNRAIQIGVVGFTAYRLAVIAAEAMLQTMITGLLNLGGHISRATLAVAGLGLAFAEGLVKAMQLGIEKFGQLIEAIAPFAAKMGIDLSGVTASLGSMNEGLDTVVVGLQGVQDAATQQGLDIAARQTERLSRLQTNLADSTAEAWAELDVMGDRMIAVDATFQNANTTLGETVRLTDDLTDSVEALMAVHLKKRIQFPDVREQFTEEQLYDAWLATSGTNRLHYFDHWGSINDESLLSKIRFPIKPFSVYFFSRLS
jgi:methyl-accepting chemotaxis protein